MRDTLEYMIGSRVRCAGEECGEVGIRRGERVHAVDGQIGRVLAWPWFPRTAS